LNEKLKKLRIHVFIPYNRNTFEPHVLKIGGTIQFSNYEGLADFFAQDYSIYIFFKKLADLNIIIPVHQPKHVCDTDPLACSLILSASILGYFT